MRRSPFTVIFPGLLVGVSLWSWGTSSVGLWSWFVDSVNPLAAGAAAGAMSGVIQLAIAGMWFGVTSRQISVLIKPLCLGLALSLSVISGALASGSYLLLTASDAFEGLLNRRSFATVSAPLSDFGDRFGEIEQRMLELSLLSGERERLEARQGTSCDGNPVQPGHGPRARMRQRVKAEAGRMASVASEVSAEALDIITLPGEVDDAKMARAYAAARQLTRDSRITRMRVWIEQTLRGFRQGFEDPRSGTHFVCRDAAFEASLAEAEELLEADITLPETPPAAVELGFAEAVQNSYAQVWGGLGALLGQNGARWDREAFHTARVAFVIAALVELLIIALVFLTAAMAGPGVGPDAPRGAPLPAWLRADWSGMAELLDRLVIEEGGRAYFLVPEDGDSVLRARARALVRRWRLRPAIAGEPLDLAEVAPRHQRALAEATGGAGLFTVYRAPRRLMRWWMRAANDLAASPAPETA